MPTFFKRLFCQHSFSFTRNVYGDEIRERQGCRSVWTCKLCGKVKSLATLV